MFVTIGSDHGGFNLKAEIKELLTELQIEFNDVGTHSAESVDYPEIAQKVGQAVISGECNYGIVICGTGIGIRMQRLGPFPVGLLHHIHVCAWVNPQRCVKS